MGQALQLNLRNQSLNRLREGGNPRSSSSSARGSLRQSWHLCRSNFSLVPLKDLVLYPKMLCAKSYSRIHTLAYDSEMGCLGSATPSLKPSTLTTSHGEKVPHKKLPFFMVPRTFGSHRLVRSICELQPRALNCKAGFHATLYSIYKGVGYLRLRVGFSFWWLWAISKEPEAMPLKSNKL